METPPVIPPIPKSLARQTYEKSQGCQVSQSKGNYVIKLHNTAGEDAFNIKVPINSSNAKGVADAIKDRMCTLISDKDFKGFTLSQIQEEIGQMNTKSGTVHVEEISKPFFSKFPKLKEVFHKGTAPAESAGQNEDRLREIASDILTNICNPKILKSDKLESSIKLFNKFQQFMPDKQSCINLLSHLEPDHLDAIFQCAKTHNCPPLLALLQDEDMPYKAKEESPSSLRANTPEPARVEESIRSRVQGDFLRALCKLYFEPSTTEAEVQKATSDFNKIKQNEMTPDKISTILNNYFEDAGLVEVLDMKAKYGSACPLLKEIIDIYIQNLK